MKKSLKWLLIPTILVLTLSGCVFSEVNPNTSTDSNTQANQGGQSGGGQGSQNTNSGNTSSMPVYVPFDRDNLSEEYLVGTDYFTGDFLEYAPTVFVKVRYDGRLEGEFPHRLSNGEEFMDIVYFDLDEESLENLRSAIDLSKLYNLDPEVSNPDEVCDGGYSYLLIYDKDGEVYKACGGFCPRNRVLLDMMRAVNDVLPQEFKDYCDRYKHAWAREQDFVPYYGDPGNTYIQTTYGVFLDYDGDLNELDDYDYLVIDAQYHTGEEILRHNGYRQCVYSYLNIGSVEEFRDYYDRFEDITLGDYENWEGEKWVDVSDERWQQFILEELAPSLLEKGVNGFFVDNCDVYYHYPTEEILEGLTVIMEGLKDMGCDCVINGGDVFLEAYTENGGDWRNIITGINQECVFTSINWDDDTLNAASDEDKDYFTEYIEKYADQGAYIFLIEYAEDIPENRPLRYNIRYYSEEHGFLYYISESIDLD